MGIGQATTKDCENYTALPPKEIAKAALFLNTAKGHREVTIQGAKPSEPIKSLILPYGELNADRASDKSLSGTAMQRLKPKKTIIKTHHIEKSGATADITKGLDTSKPVKEVANQPETTAIKKVSVLKFRGTASSHSQTSQRESGKDKGYPRPNIELVLAIPCPVSSVYPVSAPRSDTFRFLMPDVYLDNSRLCNDQQRPAHESQTIRVPEHHSEPKPILADETMKITLDADLEKRTLDDDVGLVSLGSI
ncbi:hypothetical protein Tco_1346402 [Tanacetum coccineum]